MKQQADEAGLDLNLEIPGAATNTIGITNNSFFVRSDVDSFFVVIFRYYGTIVHERTRRT